MIQRHVLNDRRQSAVRLRYKRGILKYGIMSGCRGECWVTEKLGADKCTFGSVPSSVMLLVFSELHSCDQ